MAATKERGETVSAYFRNVFAEKPHLLEGRSNQEVLDRWLADHPGETEVPSKVKTNLQNIKSVLRKEARNKKKDGRPKKETATTGTATNGAPAQASTAHASPASAMKTTASGPDLAKLEEQLDDCMSMAKYMDAEGLEDVITLIRQARNRVVRRQGE